MPLIVAGTGFGSGESVRVTASVNAKNETRRVSAGGTGKLRVRFAIGSTTCAMVTVIAVGARGSRAAVKIVPVCAEPGPIG